MAIIISVNTGWNLPARGKTESGWNNPAAFASLSKNRLVTIVLGFVGPFDGHAKVIGLLLRQLGQLHTDFFQVQAGDFFVELLRQTINADFVNVFILPEIELRERLVG